METKMNKVIVGFMAMMMTFSFCFCEAYGGGLFGNQQGSGNVGANEVAFTYELVSAEVDGTPCVVIAVTSVESRTMLIDVMAEAKKNGDFTYEVSGGMITSINGIANPADWSKCWMLYTSDAEMSNTAWGQVTYEGQTYGSAVVGAEALDVIAGGLYIWSYQSF